jgi:hypothetical protein
VFFLSLHRRSRCLQDGRVTANLDLTRPGGSTAGPLRRLCASHGQAAAAAGVFRTASPPPVFPRCAAAVSLPAASRSGAAPPGIRSRPRRPTMPSPRRRPIGTTVRREARRGTGVRSRCSCGDAPAPGVGATQGSERSSFSPLRSCSLHRRRGSLEKMDVVRSVTSRLQRHDHKEQ